jgi:hypothetical protein
LYGASSFFETIPQGRACRCFEHFDAVAFGVFDVLNAATGTLNRRAEDSFALGKRLFPNVFSVVHQNIEGESGGRPVIDPAMQGIELCNAI